MLSNLRFVGVERTQRGHSSDVAAGRTYRVWFCPSRQRSVVGARRRSGEPRSAPGAPIARLCSPRQRTSTVTAGLMPRLDTVTWPDWVPQRMTRYARHSRSTRWLTARPERLLGWWFLLVLFAVAGIVLALVVMPTEFVAAFLVPTVLQLVVDVRYMPRAFRAWRGDESMELGR